MRQLAACVFLICFICFAPGARADAQVREWIGFYNMNRDGHLGVLRIDDSKQDCATSPCFGFDAVKNQ